MERQEQSCPHRAPNAYTQRIMREFATMLCALSTREGRATLGQATYGLPCTSPGAEPEATRAPTAHAAGLCRDSNGTRTPRRLRSPTCHGLTGREGGGRGWQRTLAAAEPNGIALKPPLFPSVPVPCLVVRAPHRGGACGCLPAPGSRQVGKSGVPVCCHLWWNPLTRIGVWVSQTGRNTVFCSTAVAHPPGGCATTGSNPTRAKLVSPHPPQFSPRAVQGGKCRLVLF